MTFSDPISLVLSRQNLDLSVPADFLLALHFARYWPGMAPIEDASWTRQRALVESVDPFIFGPFEPCDVRKATWKLFCEFEGGLGGRPFAVFRMAFHSGLIDEIAYGAALRCILSLGAEHAAPWHPAYAIEAQRELLTELAMASPMGLMGPHEIEAWEALPDKLTIYRGGCSGQPTRAAALLEGSHGIFWTPDAKSARFYFAHRAEQRVAEGNAGWPFLIAADVERSALLGMGVFGELNEMFVDFDAIDPAGVRCMLPQEVVAA